MARVEEMLAEAIETMERVGCRGTLCNGPTLHPEDMVTCYLCTTLARCRQALGPPRTSDEETLQVCYEGEPDRHLVKLTERIGRRGRDLVPGDILTWTKTGSRTIAEVKHDVAYSKHPPHRPYKVVWVRFKGDDDFTWKTGASQYVSVRRASD